MAASAADAAALTALLQAGGVTPSAEIAADMLAHGRSLHRILSPSLRRRSSHDRADALVGAAERLFAQALRRRMADGPILPSRVAVIDHLHLAMAGLGDEQVRILYTDARFRLLADDVLATGGLDHVVIDIRRVLRTALEIDARALILAHNHPGGSLEPSTADRRVTRQLAEAARAIGIDLIDHLIITAAGHTSLRDLGFL